MNTRTKGLKSNIISDGGLESGVFASPGSDALLYSNNSFSWLTVSAGD